MSFDLSNQQIGQIVGARLRAARLAKKLTQSQLARPDFSVSYVSAIERGQIHPSLRALETFAQRLGISSADLISKQTPQEIAGVSAINGLMLSAEGVALQLLEAQILIRQSAAQQAITQLRSLVSKKLTPEQEIRLRYLLGWAYFNMALLQEAESVLAEALKLVEGPDDHLSVQILNLLGMVHASMRNYAQALQYQQRCLDKLEKEQQPRDAFFIAQVCTNMGLLYINQDKFDEAIQMFQRALAITEGLTTPGQLKSMYGDLFQYYVETKDYPYAVLNGHKYLELHLQERSNSLRSEIYHYLGRAMMQGDQQQALTYLERALQSASAKQDQLAFASVSSQMAEWLLTQGKFEEAHEYAREAYMLALPFGDVIITAHILAILGRNAYAQKDYEAGDTHFVAGLEMLERLGAREELVDQYTCYAQLLEDRGMAKEALMYYKKAWEIQQKPV
jgi:tetratricopeptide (TPR) repeat protein